MAAADRSSTSAAAAQLWDLDQLDRARNFNGWLARQYAGHVRGRVLEVGAGIGTYTRLLLERGVDEVVAVEPERACADELERRFADDERVTVLRDTVPSASLAELEGTFDLVVCQNVLEHIEDDAATAAALAHLLTSGGTLVVLVPAHPRLFGSLDRRYDHHRRYSRAALLRVVEDAGLAVVEVRSFNLLGVPGWVVSSWRRVPRIDGRALALYDRLVPLWSRIEDRLRPPWGLSLIAIARRP